LNRHGHHELADRRPAHCADTSARAIDVSDQIQLLRHPRQGAYISNSSLANDLRGAEVHGGRWPCGAQDGLSRYGPPTRRVPQGLRCDAVAAPIDFAFEDVHISFM